jgi:hypothetical protein
MLMHDIGLEIQKQKALETLRSYSKILTEPSENPQEPPHIKYTLRGVCTTPSVTYVLRREQSSEAEQSGTPSTNLSGQWQWWRISFSVDDAKDAEKSGRISKRNNKSSNADIAGYTALRVREVEVIRAARDESNNILLVYANENALRFPEGALPPQLQVIIDIYPRNRNSPH